MGLRPASAQADYIAELHAKAKQEGELTWYSVYWPSDRSEKHGALFTKAFPGVKVNVVRSTAQVAYQRLSQDLQANAANCDVFSTTDMGQFVALKDRGALMPYRMKSIDQIDSRFQNVDPDDAYQIVNATTVGLAYNTNKVKPEQAPKSWKEFIDPKWKGQSVVGHPGFSRLRRHLGGADEQALWLGLFRATGGAEAACRPLHHRYRHGSGVGRAQHRRQPVRAGIAQRRAG